MCTPVDEVRGRNNALFKSSINNIRKYFELAMRVASESCARVDSVLIKDTQVPEPRVTGVTISKHDAGPISADCPYKNDGFPTHEAKENVWNVLSQPWSAWPLSVEGLRTTLVVDILFS